MLGTLNAARASTEPRVAISVVNHGNRDRVLALLTGLAPVSDLVPCETLVLDNASEDGSVEAIREAFPDVTVIAQDHRAGFGANHNRVIRATRTEYVLLVNDDALVAPATVDVLVGFLDGQPEAGAVGPRIVDEQGKVWESAWAFPSPWLVLLFAVTFGRLRGAQSRASRARPVDQLSACVLLLRRSALDEVGLFDDGYFMYLEDTDLSHRLRDAGHERWLLPAAVVQHHRGASTEQLTEARIVEEWRSRRRYWRKHYGPVASPTLSALRGAPYFLGWLGLALAELPLRGTWGQARLRARAWRLHGLNAFGLGRGAGLREVAERWNQNRTDRFPA